MDHDYWLTRWREGRTGFHQQRPTPQLEAHWDAIGAPPGSTVLVPLAGKSRDMDWLAARGHRVIGIELSQLAVQQFFAERGIEPEVFEDANGIHHCAGAIDLIHGDAFALDAGLLASCNALYDRAAMIALPPDMRRTYASTVYAGMPPGCRALLITLDYPQHERPGPPFAVSESETHDVFGDSWSIEVLDRKVILDEQPGFVADGVTVMHALAFRMLRAPK